MQCPHCGANLKYRERSDYRCSRCHKQFALEPKQNKLKLHDLAFRRRLDQVSQYGKLYFTADQLRYQVSRKQLTSLATPYPVWRYGFCLIITFLALLLPSILIVMLFPVPKNLVLKFGQTQLNPQIWLPLVVFVFIIGISIAIFLLYQRVHGDIAPALSLPEFQHDVLGRWEQIYPGNLERLIRPDLLAHLPDSPPASRMRGALVCDQRDILNFLQANRVPARLGLALLPLKEPFSATQQAALDRLRSQPDLPVLVLHDASPTGWLLPYIVTRALQLSADQHVIDVGIKLADAMAQKMPTLRKNLSDAQLKQLKTHVPASVPMPHADETTQHSLSTEEFEWLAKGWYTPLVALNPGKLIRMVARTARQHCPAPARQPVRGARPRATPVVDAEQQAQIHARAVGFMSWPGG